MTRWPTRPAQGAPPAGSTDVPKLHSPKLPIGQYCVLGETQKSEQLARTSAGPRDRAMGEGRTVAFDDPDRYAAGFDDVRVNLTIAGCGDFRARLTRIRLNHLELLACSETLPCIAHISLPPDRVFLSFPLTAHSTLNGFDWRKNDIAFHGRAESVHLRSTCGHQWGLISMPPELLASTGEALIGRPITSPQANTIVRPSRRDALRFQHLFRGACHLAERRRRLFWSMEVTRALEQEMLHAIVHCLTANEVEDRLKTRRHHAAVMARLEDALTRRVDRKVALSEICDEIEVPERTLRMCCEEFVGVSPMRYLLLQRLNRARSALKRADPSTTSVAEIARNHQFLELGRFAVTYRATFGESPSATLAQDPEVS